MMEPNANFSALKFKPTATDMSYGEIKWEYLCNKKTFDCQDKRIRFEWAAIPSEISRTPINPQEGVFVPCLIK